MPRKEVKEKVRKHPPRKGEGRPTKLNDDVQKKIANAIGLGAPYELAGLYAGVGRTTIWQWIKRGEREGRGKYFEFSNAIKKAEGQALVGTLATINKAKITQWQAAAWWLERKYPRDWGRVSLDIKHSGDNESPIKIDFSGIDKKTLKDLADEAKRRAKKGDSK